MKNLKEIWEALLSGETLDNKSNRLKVKLVDGSPQDQNGKTAVFMSPIQWTLAPKPKKLYAYKNIRGGDIKFFPYVLIPEKAPEYLRAKLYDITYGENK